MKRILKFGSGISILVMKKILALIISLITFNIFSFSSDNVEISVLTCSPGTPVYSVFGHTAIRVVDKKSGEDIVFNFGTFDFDTPNFVLKFIEKKLEYWLSIQDTEDFISDYTYEGRLVTEQKLNLTEQQEEKLLENLEYLYLPENRYYLYSFLDKNCTTEIRDLLVEVGIKFPEWEMKETSRDLIISYVKHKPWLKLGINLLLGNSADKKTNSYKSMFLPDYLYSGLNNLKNGSEDLVELKTDMNSISQEIGDKTGYFWYSPLFIFTLLLVLILTWKNNFFDLSVLSIIGLLGLLLLIVTNISSHQELRGNLNILWCTPFYLIYPFTLKSRFNKWFSYLFLLTILATIIIWVTGVQRFDISIIPLLAVLTVLNLRMLKNNNHLKIGFL